MQLFLAKLKVNAEQSGETECFTADLCVQQDGKPVKIASVSNDGNGCTHNIQIEPTWRGIERQIWKYLDSLPPVHLGMGISLVPTLDFYITQLVEEEKVFKQLKTKCAKHTVFRLKKALQGDWLVSKKPFTPEIKTKLINAYNDNIEAFANEDIRAFIRLDRSAS